MDGSLIADTANAIASFANVGATVALGYLVYKFTKRDEAGRIETALENDRLLRREDWARERRARLVNPALDLLSKIPQELLNVASFLDKPLARQPTRDAVDNLATYTGALVGNIARLPNNGLRLDCGQLTQHLNELGAEIALHVRNDKNAIPSWVEHVKVWCLYLINISNEVASQITDWQDGETFNSVNFHRDRPKMPPPAQYPSLGD